MQMIPKRSRPRAQPAFSSEPLKPTPWQKGDMTPSVLHEKLEVRRWNRRVHQAATVPAWQCKKAWKGEDGELESREFEAYLGLLQAYFSGINRVPTPIFL